MADRTNVIVRPAPFPTAARSQSPADSVFTNNFGRGILVALKIINIASTGGLTLYIDGRDPETQEYYNILTSAAFTSANNNSLTILKAYPGLTPVANQVANDIVPKNGRIRIVHADQTNLLQYSASAQLLL